MPLPGTKLGAGYVQDDWPLVQDAGDEQVVTVESEHEVLRYMIVLPEQ